VADGMQLEVKNAKEVQRAIDKFAQSADDLKDINADVGNLLLGDIKSNTRRNTGELAASWEVSAEPMQAQFSNPQSYAVVQEFGGVQIEPTNAVASAYEANQDGIAEAYGSGLAGKAKRIGFDTKGG
jgi:hypothetical protein